jgi:GNAT superfamily N-acetyltransferase
MKNITYLTATAENWSDIEDLFSTSEECNNCWCMNHRLPPDQVIVGEAARTSLKASISSGIAKSILAFSDKKCIGWCAVDSTANQPGHDYCFESPENVSKDIWSIHCIYIHPGFRGMGISTNLLKHAVELAKNEGAIEVLAFPIPEETRHKFPLHDAEFSGRLSSYLKLGFCKKKPLNDFYSVVGIQLKGNQS